MGPRYSEPIRAEEEAREIDDFYKMTTTDGTLSWHYASSYTSDSK